MKSTQSGRLSLQVEPTPNVPFTVVKHAVSAQFERMKAEGVLYQVSLAGGEETDPEQRLAATRDALWTAYLASFPEGTNPVYRERTDHDCACCRHFVKVLGGAVAIVDGAVVSIWDFPETGTYYDEVAAAMRELVRSAAIDNVFLHVEETAGTDKSFERVMDGLDAAKFNDRVAMEERERSSVTAKAWDHFFVRLPAFAKATKTDMGPRLSQHRSTFDVLRRALDEISLEAVDTVLELVAQNSLYKGEENRFTLAAFRALKAEYDKLANDAGGELSTAAGREYQARALALFVWRAATYASTSVSRIRSTAIGTLLIDLSGAPARTYEAGECASTICAQRGFRHVHEGAGPLDVEDAVARFEAMVAPQNYKRPTALVTKAMIDRARAKIEELGFASALERRYAVMDDVAVSDVLYVDRGVARLKGQKDAFAALAETLTEAPRAYDKVEEVHVDKFLAEVLPGAKRLEVMFENRHAGNLVSLVAPVDPGSRGMFKWPNDFSWSYAGDVTDSIKERVKAAGGAVVGDLCCRLAWDYKDDLDLHMLEPEASRRTASLRPLPGYHISYGNRRVLSPNGGTLDLDANGCDGQRDDPAENIVYADRLRMGEGTYQLYVHNYNRRSTGSGFTVEVEFDGTVHTLTHPKALRTDQRVDVATVEYSRAAGFKLKPGKEVSTVQASRELWGLRTQAFQRVSMAMLSPNYWGAWPDEAQPAGVGNRHLFFMLDNARNAEGARGFYNEFLSAELEPHRKVMEQVGARMRTDESDRQLSGLGFSSTRRDSVLVRVTGALARVVRVTF